MNETEQLPVWMIGLSNPDSTGCTWYRLHAAGFDVIASDDHSQTAYFYSRAKTPGVELKDSDIIAHFRAAHVNVIAEANFIAPQQGGNVEPRKPH